MTYTITKQFQRGGEINDGTFNTLDEAKNAIQEKLRFDQQLKIQTVYRLYDEFEELQGSFDINSLEQDSQGSSPAGESASSAGKGSGFNPTPFNMAPRPSSIPHSWITDEDKSEKKDDGK